MYVECSIDWIAYTIKNRTDNPIPPYLYLPHAKSCHPINGYEFGREHRHGVRVYVAPRREDMGEYVVMSGKTLEKMRLDAHPAYEFLDEAKVMSPKFTRVDLAVDIFDGPFNVRDCRQWRKDGLLQSRLQGETYFDSETPDGIKGDTLYIGNKKSKSGFVRIYDKRAEQRALDGPQWIRVEAQFKHRKANSVVNKLWSSHDKASETAGIVNGFCSFDHQDWRQVFTDKKIKVRDTRLNDGTQKRRDWILTDVASAIASHIKEAENGRTILQELENEVIIKVLEAKNHNT